MATNNLPIPSTTTKFAYTFLNAVGFGLTYLLVARASLFLVVKPEGIAVVWPPSGLAVAVLLLNNRRDRWGLLLALFCANILANTLGGNSLLISLAFAIANCAESALFVFLIDRFVLIKQFSTNFTVVQQFLVLAAISNAVTALLGAAIPTFFFGANFWHNWFTWWIADGLGIIVITPIILVWAQGQPTAARTRPKPARIAEGLLLIIVMTAGSVYLFFTPYQVIVTSIARAYLFYPLLIWMVFRFEARFVISLMVLTMILAVTGTALGYGQFAEPQQATSHRLMTVQIFMGTAIFITYSLATLLAENSQAQTALMVSEQRLRLASEAANFGWYHWDFVNKNGNVSPKFKSLIGLQPDDDVPINYDSIFAMIHPEDRAGFLAAIQTSMDPNGSGIFNHDFRISLKDGAVRWIQMRGLTTFSEQGSARYPLSASGVLSDLSERKLLEHNLQEQHSFLSQIINTMGQGLAVTDAAGCFEMVNPACAELLGYTSSELIGMPSKRMTAIEDLAILDEAHQRHLNRETTIIQCRAVRADGSLLPVLITNSPRIKNGHYTGAISVFTDLSAMKQAELALREINERFSTIFHSSPETIVISNLKNGVIVDANQAYCALLELQREQIIGHTGRDLGVWLNAGDRDQLIATIRKQGMVSGFDMPFRTRSGRIGTAIISAVIIHIAGEEHLLLMGMDNTARKQFETELEQRVLERTADLQIANASLEKASQMKDEFLATMSHELRTPLTGILGLSQSLQQNTYGELNEKQTAAIKIIEKSGLHLHAMVTDILDLTRLQTGKLELDPLPCSLTDICTTSLQMLETLAANKKQTLSFSTSPDVIKFTADQQRIRQIITNLLSNAIKFTPEGGAIKLALIGSPESRQIKISVTDNGIGIKPEDLPRLFQSFQQLDARLARQYNGAGLGLVLVKHMVELHGGSVEVESVFGQGSCFTVILPWL